MNGLEATDDVDFAPDTRGEVAAEDAPPKVKLTEEEKKKAKKAKDAEKAREEKAVECVRSAEEQALEATLDRDLDGAENDGALVLADPSFMDAAEKQTDRVAAAEKIAAEKRAAYVGGFQITTRSVAAWAVKKFIEAKDWSETIKDQMRREVGRAERNLEERKAFFEEKLLKWGLLQKRDTKAGIRMPEAGARLEFGKAQTGGVEIVDSELLKEALLSKLGRMECVERGLVRTRTELVEGAALAYLDSPERRKEITEGYVYSPPGEVDVLKIVRT